jgi:DNA-binding transcriptional ArsR family regulator
VNDLVERLDMSQPAVSKHLRVLREVGLVGVRSDAQSRLYRVRPEPLEELDAAGDGCRLLFAHFLSERNQAARDAAGWEVRLRELDRLLAGEEVEPPGMEATPEWRDLYEEYVAEGVPSGAEIPEAS